jgi:hypothetical protein
MPPQLVCHSALTDFSPDFADGFGPLRSYEDLQRAIEARLGPGAADILARPVVRPERNGLAWLLPFGGAIPFEALGPAEKNSALGRLSFEARRLFALGKEMEASAWLAERPVGKSLVKAAWRLAAFAAGAQGPVRIFSAPGGLLSAAGWGVSPKAPAAPPSAAQNRQMQAILSSGFLPPELRLFAPRQETPAPPLTVPRREGGFLWNAIRALTAAAAAFFLCAGLFWLLFPAVTGLKFHGAPPPKLDASAERDRQARLWSLREEYWRTAAGCPAQEARLSLAPLPKPERAAVPNDPEEAPDYLPVKPEPPRPPEKLERVSDLEGCWVLEVRDSSGALTVRETFCFDANGRATNLAERFTSGGKLEKTCQTSDSASMDGPNKIIIARGKACPGWRAHDFACRLKSPGVITCVVKSGNNSWSWDYFHTGKK